MRLRARRIERAIRREVKSALRASGTLWGDFRQVRKRRRQNMKLPGWLIRLFFLLCVAFMFAFQGRPIEVVAAAIALWTVGTALLRAGQLRSALYLAPALGVYKYLPIADRAVFMLQWQSYLRLAFWSAVDLSVGYTILASKVVHATNFINAGIVLGVIQSVFVTITAVVLYSFVRPKFFWFGPLFILSAIAMALFGSNQLALAKSVVHFAYWLPSTGWIFHLLGLVNGPGWFFDLVPAMMAAAVLALFPIAWNRARRYYQPTEELFAAAERATSTNPVPTLQGVAEHFKEDPAVAQAALESRALLQPLDWDGLGLVERAISRLLNPRERLIAEFMLAGNPQWTKRLKAFAIFLVFGLIFLLIVGPVTPIARGLVFITVFVLLFNTQAWPGFGLPRGSGLQSPFYALIPFGFRELMITVMKVNLARFLILVPVLTLSGWLFSRNLQLETGRALVSAVKLIWVGIAIQPVVALMPVSAQSSDSARPLFLFTALFFILATLGSGVAFFMAKWLSVAFIAGVCLLLLPASALLIYEAAFNRARFDLVPIRTQQTTFG